MGFARARMGVMGVGRVKVSIFRVTDQSQPRSRTRSVGWAVSWFANREEQNTETKYSLWWMSYPLLLPRPSGLSISWLESTSSSNTLFSLDPPEYDINRYSTERSSQDSCGEPNAVSDVCRVVLMAKKFSRLTDVIHVSHTSEGRR